MNNQADATFFPSTPKPQTAKEVIAADVLYNGNAELLAESLEVIRRTTRSHRWTADVREMQASDSIEPLAVPIGLFFYLSSADVGLNCQRMQLSEHSAASIARRSQSC